jgi:hypothetical protein
VPTPTTQFSVSWEWLGGFFDGEGCIEIKPQNYGRSLMTVRLSIAQYGKNSWILNEIKSFLEEYGVTVYLKPKSKGGLYVNPINDVKFVLNELLPYLGVKRERAEECLKYIEEMKEAKERYGMHEFSKYLTPPKRLRGVI